MRKLKIAILASNLIRIPPQPKDIPPAFSGAPEKIVSIITEGLVKKGHKVTLFASGDSKTKAKLFSVTKKQTWKDKKIGFFPAVYAPGVGTIGSSRLHERFELLLISKAYQMAKNFDLINSHFDILSAFFAPLVKTKTVSTLHSPLVGTRKEILINFKNSQYYISISNAQRKPIPDLNYAATIYHGIDYKKVPFNSKPKNYLIISGRIHPVKGIKEAIYVAKKVNLPLIIIGSHEEKEEYWKKEIKPEIDGKKIIYKGFLPKKEMFKIISAAKALIFPVQWDEPFGLTLIEAMACGTPVVAFDRGSIKEIVKNEETGFVVPPIKNGEKNLEDFEKAVKKINEIKREKCREWIEKNFSLEKMIENYEKTFYKIVENG